MYRHDWAVDDTVLTARESFQRLPLFWIVLPQKNRQQKASHMGTLSMV